MPVFDFLCQQCQHQFAELVNATEQINCPVCQSNLVKKVFSGFNKISDDTRFEAAASDLPSMQDFQRFKQTGRLKRPRH